MRAARRKAMDFTKIPGPMLPVDMEPLSPPDLVAGVAQCLDNFVLQTQTQEQLYEAIRATMGEFHAKNQAYRLATQRQSPPPVDKANFAQIFEEMMARRLDYEKDDGQKDL